MKYLCVFVTVCVWSVCVLMYLRVHPRCVHLCGFKAVTFSRCLTCPLARPNSNRPRSARLCKCKFLCTHVWVSISVLAWVWKRSKMSIWEWAPRFETQSDVLVCWDTAWRSGECVTLNTSVCIWPLSVRLRQAVNAEGYLASYRNWQLGSYLTCFLDLTFSNPDLRRWIGLKIGP